MIQFEPEGLKRRILDLSESRHEHTITGFTDQRLFSTYVDEAFFYWRFLKRLIEEKRPARALEVGAGVGLLSLFAQSEIESVTALEPESSGFGRMSTFRKVILSAWRNQTEPEFKECFLHELPVEEPFDFIYCVNVLEHVPEPEKLLAEMYARLSPGGLIWCVSPNYTFPYEQHFEIPILINKQVTERLFWSQIKNHVVSPDPTGLWSELSWPTQSGLRKFLMSSGWTYRFHKIVLEGYFDRLSEPGFIGRKGGLYKALRPLIKLLKPVIIGLPLRVVPIIEFTINKPGTSQSSSSSVEK